MSNQGSIIAQGIETMTLRTRVVVGAVGGDGVRWVHVERPGEGESECVGGYPAGGVLGRDGSLRNALAFARYWREEREPGAVIVVSAGGGGGM